MKRFRRLMLIEMTLVISLMIVPSNSKTFGADPSTIRVPTDFLTIQAAINAAQPGDTVFVLNGTYVENVIVNKTVSLVGENKSGTIIDGGGNGHIVNVTASNVVISGFTLRNSGEFSGGVYLDASRNTTVSGNILRNSYFGVWFDKSTGNSVVSNTLFNNTDAIYMTFSTGNFVEGNFLSNNTEGIRLEWFSNLNVFRRNFIINNADGVFIGKSVNNILVSNYISNNIDGLFLSNAGFCTVNENVFANNTYGVSSFISNSSVFYRNNFLNNTSQVFSFNSTDNVWDNGAEGNYWSDNVGQDLNGDGVSDVPYNVATNNVDRYPLMEPWSRLRVFDVVWRGTIYKVTVWSNTTVASERSFGFHFLPYSREIHFNVTGPSGVIGFFNVTVPVQLLLGSSWRWEVFLSGVNMTGSAVSFVNATHVSLFLSFGLSTRNVVIVNEPSTDIFVPFADAGGNQTVRVGDLVTFNASGSFDNVGIVSFEWDFGDGNVTVVSSTVVTHVFAVVGSYDVRLVVRDAVGNSASDRVTVTVLGREEGGFPWWVWVVLVVVLVGGVALLVWFLIRRARVKKR